MLSSPLLCGQLLKVRCCKHSIKTSLAEGPLADDQLGDESVGMGLLKNLLHLISKEMRASGWGCITC